MHQIHTTAGFIIFSRPYGEADKLISIFTRDFGLVTATARGIRLEKSKLRYHAQDYSLGVFSLVRGKEFWRLTSAAGGVISTNAGINDHVSHPHSFGGGSSFPQPHKGDREGLPPPTSVDAEEASMSHIRDNDTQQLMARMALLLRRLLHGEEAHPELFDCLEGCVGFISGRRHLPKELTEDQLKTLESITVLRILKMLGYIGHDSIFDAELNEGTLSVELLNNLAPKRVIINQHINKALRESQL